MNTNNKILKYETPNLKLGVLMEDIAITLAYDVALPPVL